MMQVEIWADVVCPWCYLGKRRFDNALGAFEHRDDVEVVYRSFELDPSAPADRSEPLLGHLSAKYGIDPAQVQAMQDRVSTLAADEGLSFRLDRARTARTFDAHRLIHLAGELGLAHEMVERLFAAYFTEGATITHAPTLVTLAEQAGIPADHATSVLGSQQYSDAVRADEQDASALGITGVPFFVVDRRLAVSGAQSPQVFAELLSTARYQRVDSDLRT
jgi:predicted DsbA family dithiol-disulfide isomerase